MRHYLPELMDAAAAPRAALAKASAAVAEERLLTRRDGLKPVW